MPPPAKILSAKGTTLGFLAYRDFTAIGWHPAQSKSIRRVYLRGETARFWIDKHSVTFAQFFYRCVTMDGFLFALQWIVAAMGATAVFLSVKWGLFFVRSNRKIARSMVRLLIEQTISSVGTMLFAANFIGIYRAT